MKIKKIEICSIESQIAGMFGYKNQIDKKLLPNIASILYSYLRPIISQLSIMAKIPPIDLHILNLSDIEVKEINNSFLILFIKIKTFELLFYIKIIQKMK